LPVSHFIAPKHISFENIAHAVVSMPVFSCSCAKGSERAGAGAAVCRPPAFLVLLLRDLRAIVLYNRHCTLQPF